MRSPNFFSAAADSVNPNPGCSFSFSRPLAIFGGSSNNSACSGSRSGSVNDSTMQPAGTAGDDVRVDEAVVVRRDLHVVQLAQRGELPALR